MLDLIKISLMLICAWVTPESLLTKSSGYFTVKDVNALHSKAANYRIFYGKDPFQFGDLRLPAKHTAHPFPVAIIVHGGCWRSKLASLQSTAALSDALRDLGIATWNIEYRSEDYPGGGWPGTFKDVGEASDMLRKFAQLYPLDLNRVIAIGHSAGGHLALWLAARHKLPTTSLLYTKDPIQLKGVVILGGVPDLKAFRQQGEKTCGEDVIGKLLGNSNQIEQSYKETSPSELLPLGISQILIYGADDEAVPPAFGKAYVQKAKAKKDSARLVEVKDAAHHEYIVPNSITWEAVKSAILSLIKS